MTHLAYRRAVAVAVAFAIVVSSLVPSPALADGTGSQVGPLWTAPLGAYSNRSEFVYAYMVNEGLAISDKSGNDIRRWNDLSVTDQVVLSRCYLFSTVVGAFTAIDPLSNSWVLLTAGFDFAGIQSELQDAYDKLHESDGPLNGGSLGGGGGIPDDEPGDTPIVDTAPPAAVDGFSSIVMYPQRCASNYDFSATYTTAFAFKVSNGTSVTTQYYDFNPSSEYGYPLPPNVTVQIRETATETINTWLSSGKDVVLLFGSGTGTGYIAEDRFVLLAYPVDSGTYTLNTPTSWEDFGITYTGPNVDGKIYSASRSQQIVDNTIKIDTAGSYSQMTAGIRKFNHAGFWYKFFSSSGGGSTGGTVTPVPEPSTIEKPESPASPSAPTVVNVDMPEINISSETVVVPPASESPDLSTIENLLRLILQADNNIITSVNELGTWLYECWDEFTRFIGEYASNVSYWLSFISGQLNDLWKQGDTVLDWLSAIDLDIQTLQAVCISGFDDVVSWLRAIFERLFASVGGSKPSVVDPQEPETVLDWLKELWGAFWDDLASILPDDLADFVDFLGQLKRYFPFSIPWDIFAILMLLVHEPVTPSVTVPVFWVPNSTDTITIDMAGWEPMAAMIRPMVALWFAYRLALMTASLLEIPDKLRRK